MVYQGQLIGHVVTEIDVGNYLRQRREALWSLIIGHTCNDSSGGCRVFSYQPDDAAGSGALAIYG